MPELPEVETTRRGVAAHVVGQCVTSVVVRERRLRQPVPAALARELSGKCIVAVRRRAKYLLFDAGDGTMIVHLGMSGSLRLLPGDVRHGTHDHLDIRLADGRLLRYNDPRRFGLVLWTRRDPLRHSLLARLGPEPLEPGFDGAYLHARSRGRRLAVKPFLMDGHIVVGVGNIYASEALHAAGIDPRRAAGRVSLRRYAVLAECVRDVLARAIAQGGTTLRDFVSSDGRPGYFRIQLAAYGREGEPCGACGASIRMAVIGQRASFFCSRCQR